MGARVRVSGASRNFAAAGVGGTNNSYATGKVVGTPLKLVNALNDQAGTGVLESLQVVDGEAGGVALDIYIFRDVPTTMGADKATFALTAAEAKTKLIGRISVASGDYSTLATGVKEATKAGIGLGVNSIQGNLSTSIAGQGKKDLWLLVVARGTILLTGDTLALGAHVLQD